ncbi:helix-turn-helix domain-containing protein [Streptomyces carpaticus]|uniref:helix-turn-helix domain-containing protein n=1 Tax=Streptomyces carpaticus TaxID=285558 RepID=UPI00220A076F|nr:helix-turn-helix domain-containing protein [Streptomyces carpaticus]
MAAENPESSDSLKGFGALVKLFRTRKGLTQEQLDPLVGYSPQAVASIEQSRRFPQRDFIAAAEEVLEATGVLAEAGMHLSRQPGLAQWFRHWAGLEERALNLWVYECRVVPGLLQSEGYARAAFESRVPALSDEQIENQIVARLERQQLLRDRPSAGYSFIIEEGIFHRHTGGAEVSRGLIDHVLSAIALRNVEVQVMPQRRETHAGLDGPMQLLETPDNQWLSYNEGQRGGHLISDSKEVGVMLQRYAKMRSQALTPEDSLSLLKRLRGEL